MANEREKQQRDRIEDNTRKPLNEQTDRQTDYASIIKKSQNDPPAPKKEE